MHALQNIKTLHDWERHVSSLPSFEEQFAPLVPYVEDSELLVQWFVNLEFALKLSFTDSEGLIPQRNLRTAKELVGARPDGEEILFEAQMRGVR